LARLNGFNKIFDLFILALYTFDISS
jgi:hypothetical protein